MVPDDYPSYAYITVNRPISDHNVPRDPLIGLLPAWHGGDLPFSPTTWGPEAYLKSFEKFTYREPEKNIKDKYPEHWDFATWALKREYSFLRDTVMLPITGTDKNTDSTPAFPKMLYYKTENEYIEEHGFLEYIREWERIQGGARPIPLWYLFLKKEILKDAKIENSDIRQILCTDPAFSRIGLIFEQHQNSLMKARTEDTHAQCGWCPFEGGWNSRIRRLEKPGNTYVEVDWTRYDGTIPPEIFYHIKRIRFSFLSKEYRTRENFSIYQWYCKNLINRFVLMPSGEVTIQRRGNPSGQVSTTPDNNMVNIFLQAFEFMWVNNLTKERAQQLWENYDTLVYGDDRLTSTPLLPDDYKEKMIEMYASIFGMWVKPENVKTSDTLEGLSFCGFTNIRVDKFYLPVPTNTAKLIASLLKPTKKLESLESLYGKVLSYKVLLHNLPDDDYAKEFVLHCELVLRRHMESAGQHTVDFTDSILDFLWRGGPK